MQHNTLFKHTLLTFFVAMYLYGSTQNTRKALFLGNSYTYVNNLPQLVADLALSTNDTLIYDSNTPGGHTLQGHFSNTTSKGKIMAGGWDYVVLQEQSQLPSFPDAQVESEVFPYATLLDSMVRQYNACANTMFYMTWGRKNGDAANCPTWPPVCTYTGMDSLLHLRYRIMADDNAAELSPVGAVWKYIRQNFPTIELYQADESHPSAAGSYAAACSFYTAIFHKNPLLVTYNFSLSATDAANIRAAAKAVVYDSLLYWNIGLFTPVADFGYTTSGNNASFTNTSLHAGVYTWDFGDGNTSTVTNPFHTYAAAGTYTVTLMASDCQTADTLVQTVTVGITGIQEQESTTEMVLSPNPSGGYVFNLEPGAGLGKNLQVMVTDVSGKTWFNHQYNTQQKTLTVECPQRLPDGVYLVHIMGEKTLTKKLVVK